jgi:hypothetical protein
LGEAEDVMMSRRSPKVLLLAAVGTGLVGFIPESPAVPGVVTDRSGLTMRSATQASVRGTPGDEPVKIKADRRISERFGAAGSEKVSWSANSRKRPGHYNVLMENLNHGTVCRLNRRGTAGESGGYARDVAVFTQRRPGHPGNLRKAVWCQSAGGFPKKVNTASNEFLPTMTGKHLLFTRYTARTDTHRVLLFDRPEGVLLELARATGSTRVFAGQVVGDYATWYRVGARRSNVFRYTISTASVAKSPRPARFARQYNPGVASDGTVYYQRRLGPRCGAGAQLVKKSPGDPPEVIHRYPRGQDGGRVYNIHPGQARPFLYFTVRDCSAPDRRATDVYGIWG